MGDVNYLQPTFCQKIKSKPLLIAKLLSIWILAASGLHDFDIVQENVLFVGKRFVRGILARE